MCVCGGGDRIGVAVGWGWEKKAEEKKGGGGVIKSKE